VRGEADQVLPQGHGSGFVASSFDPDLDFVRERWPSMAVDKRPSGRSCRPAATGTRVTRGAMPLYRLGETHGADYWTSFVARLGAVGYDGRKSIKNQIRTTRP